MRSSPAPKKPSAKAEIVARAEKAKREGTLSNAEIDAFVAQLSPVLDAPKRRQLLKIAEKLKRL